MSIPGLACVKNSTNKIVDLGKLMELSKVKDWVKFCGYVNLRGFRWDGFDKMSDFTLFLAQFRRKTRSDFCQNSKLSDTAPDRVQLTRHPNGKKKIGNN